jgi:ribosomal-protein-alanine N-acetyltransferase
MKNSKNINILLSGKRVYLRSPKSSDCDEVIYLSRKSMSLHRGLVSPPKTTRLYTEYLKRSQRKDNASFFICRKEEHTILGAINLSQIFRGGFLNAYLGYFIGEPFANQGYMTEAMKLILKYAFEGLKLHRLEANIQPHNIASIKLVKRAGFKKEGFSQRYLKICGRWRDHERWAITAETWKK